MVATIKTASPKDIDQPFIFRFLVDMVLAALSAVLLMLAMPPYGIWPLALFGLLPIILAPYCILLPRLSSLAAAVIISGLIALYRYGCILAISRFDILLDS
jgi:apolipoprotein N-acyltransferase